MRHVAETPVRAYAHCVNPRCRGNTQEEVDAIERELVISYQEAGGDSTFSHPERTMTSFVFADEEVAKCHFCGRNRELSASPRLQLENEFGQQDFLLDIAPESRYDPKTQAEVADRLRAEEQEKMEAENAELRSAVNEQAASIARLEGYMLGRQQEETENE